MTSLVTGGAGYIGAHVVHALRAAEQVVVLDNLSSGSAARVPDDVPLVKADVRDLAEVSRAVRHHGATGVIHLAARKDVAESVVDPLSYYATTSTACGRCSPQRPSTARTTSSSRPAPPCNGTSPTGRVNEQSPTAPANAYGRTELAGEWMLRDAAQATGLRFVALRYFNVAGAGSPQLGDAGETNPVPRLLRAIVDGRPAQVYGIDHPTPDGSCVQRTTSTGTPTMAPCVLTSLKVITTTRESAPRPRACSSGCCNGCKGRIFAPCQVFV